MMQPSAETKASAQYGVGASNFTTTVYWIGLLDLDVLVGTAGETDRGHTPGEDDVIGGEGLPVVPGDALLGIPGHGPAIGAKGAVFAARNRLRQQASEVAVATE